MNNNEKIGLITVKFHPLHNGHTNLIYRMLCECKVVIIVLGSAQHSGTISHPYNVKERIDFIHTVFGNSKKIKILAIKDINAVSKKEWSEFVLSELEKAGFPTPTDYYGGCEDDVNWFSESPLKLNVLDRYRDSLNMSGTQIRQSIANNGKDWYSQVPYCIKDKIEEYFPKHLILENIIKNK